MLKLHAQKVDDDAIGKILNRTADSVCSKRKNMKLKIQHPSKGIRRDFSKFRGAIKSFMKESKTATKTEVAANIHERFPTLADENDLNPKGIPYYVEAVTDNLRKSKDLYKKVGKQGRCILWKYIRDDE
jgi:hypothetical protein